MAKTAVTVRPATLETGKTASTIPKLQQGFTLLELMVVVALIGLLSTAVVLNLTPRPDTRPDQFLHQLQLQMQSLTTQSMVQQRWYGVIFSENQYQLVRQVNNKWQSAGANSNQPAELPENFELEADGVQVNLNAIATKPQILFSPDGNYSAFRLNILANDQTYFLTDPYAVIQ